MIMFVAFGGNPPAGPFPWSGGQGALVRGQGGEAPLKLKTEKLKTF